MNRQPREKFNKMYDYWKIIFKEDIVSFQNFMIKTALKYKQKFKKLLEGYEERGILNSEMLLICSIIKELDIDLIIESGRYKGRSTEILAKFFLQDKVRIVSIERLKNGNAKYVEQKLKHYSNLKMLYGDSHKVIPKILRKKKERKIAILFDGPKGEIAINIFKSVILKYFNVMVGFFHDMRILPDVLHKEGRKLLVNTFERFFFSDNEDFIVNFKHLDLSCIAKENSITAHSWRPWMKGYEKSISYGPTIAVVVPSLKDRIKLYNEKNLVFFIKKIRNRIKKVIEHFQK